MNGTCKFFRGVFSSSRLWRALVERCCAPVKIGNLSDDWRLVFARLYPNFDALRRHVQMMQVGRCCSLPPANAEGAAFFLYFHWKGERTASDQRIVKLATQQPAAIQLHEGVVMLQVEFQADLPFLSYGVNGVSSLVDLVMVNRRVAGNKKTLCTFDRFWSARVSNVIRNDDADDHHDRDGGVVYNMKGSCAEEWKAKLLLHVSTPSRKQYAQMGEFAFQNPEHYFDIAAARSANMSHAEARHFSSADVDHRLRQSTAYLPAIAAGGCRSICLIVSIDYLWSEVMQLPAVETRKQDAQPPMEEVIM